MADQELEKGLIQYRVIIHNANPDGEAISSQLEEELGEGIEIVDWEHEREWNYDGYIPGHPHGCILPQRDVAILVTIKDPTYVQVERSVKGILDTLEECSKIVGEHDGLIHGLQSALSKIYREFPDLIPEKQE